MNENSMRLQQMVEDVTNISNLVFHRPEHQHIQQLQGRPAQVEAMEIKYVEKWEQYQREKLQHRIGNGDGNPHQLAQLQLEHDEMIK